MDKSKKRIALNFDLDQDELLRVDKNPLKLYKQIERELKRNNFEKTQQSSFISKDNMEMSKVIITVANLGKKLPWFSSAVNNFTATYENDIMDLLPAVNEEPNFLNFSNKQNGLISNSEEENKQMAIHFDLAIKEIDKYFSYRSKPYYQIAKVMKDNNFYHQQGSGYVSNEKISQTKLFAIINELKINVRHFEDVIKHLDATHLKSIWNLKPYIEDETLLNNLIETMSQTEKNKQSKKSIQSEMESQKEM